MTRCLRLDELGYASHGLRTPPPRTALRVAFACLRWLVRQMVAVLRVGLLVLAYTALAAGVVLHRGLRSVAAFLLFLRGLRWHAIAARTMRAARWVDVKTLATTAFLRRRLVPSR